MSLSNRQRIFVVLFIGAMFVTATLLYVDHSFNINRQLLIKEERQLTEVRAEDLSNTLRHNIEFLSGVPEMSSHLENVIAAVLHFGASRSPSLLDFQSRKSKWTNAPALNNLSRFFSITQHSLNVDHIFLVNAAGDCIADSDWDKAGSAIGVNYADRVWFHSNKIGKAGMQYAVGKTTHVAGLYFSSPIFEKGRFLGAVITKINMNQLSNILNDIDGYVADRNGVIILAHDKHIELQSLPDSHISELSKQQKLSVYQKEVFQTLPLQRVADSEISDLYIVEGENFPHFLAHRQLEELGLTVYVENDLPELKTLERERALVLFIVSILGGAISVLIAVSSAYVQKIRKQNLELKKSEDNLRIAATAFETHEAIMITDAGSNIIQVNKAFQNITGYSADEVIGKNPRILSSGRESKEFYSKMWSELLNNGIWDGEIWDRRKSGEVYPKWLTITAVKNDSNETTEYVGIFSDISVRKKAEDEIHDLAFYDVLTKLPNRRLLMERIGVAISSSLRSNNYCAILFLDLDKFKSLNDTLGHSFGDSLLIDVARRIQASVREIDTVARLGGDEFVVLIEDVDSDVGHASQKVALIAEKIRIALNEPFQLKEHLHHSSSSIGVNIFKGNEQSIEEIFKHADIAMYQAKKAGRNALSFFDPDMQQSIMARLSLENDLKIALPSNQFFLCYQPVISSEGRVVGVEALIRWKHPTRGIVSPAEFIPLAEESDLILDLGNWVLYSACTQLVNWAKVPDKNHLTIAVNISARQLKQENFVSGILETIEQTSVNPRQLKLEITESMLVDDVENTISKMNLLKAIGVHFSLDDFGTGYSSLSYLSRLPLDQLKIDQSFVKKIEQDDSSVVICAATISLAHNLNLKVVAEGVESFAHSYFLCSVHKCDYLQGYLFSKPIPVDEFENWLRQNSGRVKI
jgi:diguanylate cyclase (GGDEF)-like protein/PAS domain S-box-containing protein